MQFSCSNPTVVPQLIYEDEAMQVGTSHQKEIVKEKRQLSQVSYFCCFLVSWKKVNVEVDKPLVTNVRKGTDS